MVVSTQASKVFDIKNRRALNFIFALSYLKMGAQLCRIQWNEKNSFVFIKNGILLHNQPYHKGQKKYLAGYPYVLSDEDIEADDWVIVKEPKNL